MERNPAGGPKWPTPGDWVAAEWQATPELPRRSRWGTDSGSLVRGEECGRGSLPSIAGGSGRRQARGGRGGGGAEITAAPPGTPRVPSGPHAGPRTMTTGSQRGRIKRSWSLRAARPGAPRQLPVAAGAGGGVPRPQPRAQVQGCPRRGARSAAPGFRAKLRACPREVVAPVQRGKELSLEKRGRGDSGGGAHALFFFSSTFSPPLS